VSQDEYTVLESTRRLVDGRCNGHDMSNIDPIPIAPHTAAKHLLLKLYLDRWFPILGKHSRRINYIDGFAGPGEYSGGEKGSPIISISSAMSHVRQGALRAATEVNFIFVERRPDFAARLRDQLSGLNLPPQFKTAVIEGEFSEVIGSILDEIETDQRRLAPTFAFVDPFGFSGIPFDLMARILRFPHCEVFINVMVEFINRFLKHPSDSIVRHFPITFGTNEVLEIPRRSGRRVDHILDLYRQQLRKHAKFVGRFDMRGKQDQQTYSLFFAFEFSTWLRENEGGDVVCRQGDGTPSSPTPTQVRRVFFRSMGIESLWDAVVANFQGKTVWMSEVEKFVVENTDYLPTHLRKILKARETTRDISLIAAPGYRRRKGTFKADKVQIRFH